MIEITESKENLENLLVFLVCFSLINNIFLFSFYEVP